jgi:copper homeostasis protein
LNYLIEIATTDFASAEAAVNGGADRIELCTALSEGGLTPSFGLIKKCREKFNVQTSNTSPFLVLSQSGRLRKV